MSEETGFDVVEDVVVGDLSDVRESRNLMPTTQRVKGRIEKPGTMKNKDKDISALKINLRLIEGITNSEGKTQYVNRVLQTKIMDLIYAADLTVKGRSEKNWWKTKQHMVEYVKFLVALGFPIKPAPNVNDDFLNAIDGRDILFDIQHEEETQDTVNEEGEKVKVKLGTFKERLRNWRKAE